MNIMVVGGNGYVFSMVLYNNLRHALNHYPSSKIWVVDNSFENIGLLAQNQFGIEFIKGDLTKTDIDKTLLNLMDVIYWGAGLVGAPKCKDNPEYAKAINQDAVERMIGQIENKYTKVCFPCTNSIYGNSTSDLCTEDTEIKPLSVYGETKYMGEKAVLSRENSCVLRLSTAMGCSFKNRLELMLHDFIVQLKYNKELVIYEPDYIRNFVSVRDIARAFDWAFEYDLRGVYNLCREDTNMTKWEIAETIKEQLGLDTNIVKGPGKDLDQRNYRISSRKIMETGFTYNYSLKDAIREIDLIT
jgi:nucleoside-diphosphate-sugar epimerase